MNLVLVHYFVFFGLSLGMKKFFLVYYFFKAYFQRSICHFICFKIIALEHRCWAEHSTDDEGAFTNSFKLHKIILKE